MYKTLQNKHFYLWYNKCIRSCKASLCVAAQLQLRSKETFRKNANSSYYDNRIWVSPVGTGQRLLYWSLKGKPFGTHKWQNIPGSWRYRRICREKLPRLYICSPKLCCEFWLDKNRNTLWGYFDKRRKNVNFKATI